MSLYILTGEMLNLLSQMEAGEIPEDAISDTLEAVGAEWSERADAVISAIKNIRAEAAAIHAEVESLKKRLERKERTAERLTEYLTSALMALGRERYESARHQVSFRTSKRAEIADDTALLEWARHHAPDAISMGKESLRLGVLKEMAETADVPYLTITEYKNIQIK